MSFFAHFRKITFHLTDPNGKNLHTSVIVPVDEVPQMEQMIEVLGLIAGDEIESNNWRLEDVTTSCPREFADLAGTDSPFDVRERISGNWIQTGYLWRRSLVDRDNAGQDESSPGKNQE